jgi:hypothetical protein
VLFVIGRRLEISAEDGQRAKNFEARIDQIKSVLDKAKAEAQRVLNRPKGMEVFLAKALAMLDKEGFISLGYKKADGTKEPTPAVNEMAELYKSLGGPVEQSMVRIAWASW